METKTEFTTSSGNLLFNSVLTEPSITFNNGNNKEVLRIESDGRIIWKDRYVESDEEFKLAMMDMHKCLMSYRY